MGFLDEFVEKLVIANNPAFSVTEWVLELVMEYALSQLEGAGTI